MSALNLFTRFGLTKDAGGGGGGYRYYRLHVTASNAAAAPGVGWLQLRSSIGGPNLATDTAKASAERSTGSYTADKAFGSTVNDFSNWLPGGTSLPTWLQYDFGAGNKEIIVQYTVRGRSYNLSPNLAAWILKGSNDGSTWDDLDTVTGQTWSTSLEDRVFTI